MSTAYPSSIVLTSSDDNPPPESITVDGKCYRLTGTTTVTGYATEETPIDETWSDVMTRAKGQLPGGTDTVIQPEACSCAEV